MEMYEAGGRVSRRAAGKVGRQQVKKEGRRASGKGGGQVSGFVLFKIISSNLRLYHPT